MATSGVWQSAARTVSGADAIISETLHIKDMTAHGGNHKMKMNRSMTHNVRGEFRRKLAQRCEREIIPLLGVSGIIHQSDVSWHMSNYMSRKMNSFALIVPKSSTRM